MKKKWKVISVRDTKGRILSDNANVYAVINDLEYYKDQWFIHSVKYNNEIFTLGDKIRLFTGTSTIMRFNLINNQIQINCGDNKTVLIQNALKFDNINPSQVKSTKEIITKVKIEEANTNFTERELKIGDLVCCNNKVGIILSIPTTPIEINGIQHNKVFKVYVFSDTSHKYAQWETRNSKLWVGKVTINNKPFKTKIKEEIMTLEECDDDGTLEEN